VGFRIPFVRTPKAPDEPLEPGQAIGRALRVTRFESTVSIVMALAALGLLLRLDEAAASTEGPMAHVFLATWLFYYALVFGAAPIYAYKSYVTFAPEVPRRKKSRNVARGLPD
jgi:hypothetical protein